MKWLIPLLAALMLAACNIYDDTDPQCGAAGECYVSLSITTAASSTRSPGRATAESRDRQARVTPQNDYDGDGREAALERENRVMSVVLVLFESTADQATARLVRQFPVTEATGGTAPAGVDVCYTTGQQPLGDHNLDLSATYHALVIANAPELAAQIVEGATTLAQLRKMTATAVCQRASEPASASHFVMSSPEMQNLSFGTVIPTNTDGTPHTDGYDRLYDLESQPLNICRLAARIDFCAQNATYTDGGYQYTVTGTSDHFTVSAIVPFNLRDDKEYVFPRSGTDGAALSPSAATYSAPLSSVYQAIGSGTLASIVSHKTVASLYAGRTTVDGSDNLIVAYPLENTLAPGTPLYSAATGVAIVGTYTPQHGTPEQLVYLAYLRHYGTADSYDILPSDTQLQTTDTQPETPLMNYGVVRNNIYRIRITGIDKRSSDVSIHLSIKVKKWDTFTHENIYI